MVEIKPFKGTRPYNEDAKNLIAPSTDHLSIENIEIFKKNNYWNYLKILNPVGQLKEADTLLEAKSHFNEMKENDVIKKDKELFYYIYQIEFKEHTQTGFLSLANIKDFTDEKIKAHEKIELAIRSMITNFTTKSALIKRLHNEKSEAPPKPTI